LCRDCGKYSLRDAHYDHPRWKVEQALKMYSNGMSMRAISRVLEVPLSTVFVWIKRRGKGSTSWSVERRHASGEWEGGHKGS
jgi:transposase-like protein